MRNLRGQFGLTLVEILVCLGIVVVLAGISLMLIGITQDKSRIQKTSQTVQILNAALEKYYDFWKEFPFEAEDVNGTGVKYNEDDIFDSIGTVSFSGTDEAYSIEALYITLSRTPGCREVISKLENAFVNDGRIIDINGRSYDLLSILDGWEMPLRYLYKDGQDSFPLIESAGPDKDFATAEDNITNRDL